MWDTGWLPQQIARLTDQLSASYAGRVSVYRAEPQQGIALRANVKFKKYLPSNPMSFLKLFQKQLNKNRYSKTVVFLISQPAHTYTHVYDVFKL